MPWDIQDRGFETQRQALSSRGEVLFWREEIQIVTPSAPLHHC